jgi:hypothetical protein
MSSDYAMWAKGAIRRAPVQSDYAGLSYEQASRRASAICAAAVESGATMNAERHMHELHRRMHQSQGQSANG